MHVFLGYLTSSILMNEVTLIFPHQLFRTGAFFDSSNTLYLVEESLFFKQYKFHKQKIAFHRASMKCFQDYLLDLGYQVHYVDAQKPESDVRVLLKTLSRSNIKKVNYIDPVDNWLEKRILLVSKETGIEPCPHRSPMFLNSVAELEPYFSDSHKRFFQTNFYISQRKKHKILVDKGLSPVGGKWTFDKENRKRYPKHKVSPEIQFEGKSKYHTEAEAYTQQHFHENPGIIHDSFIYPINHAAAKDWFRQFLVKRFSEFGDYEDAIVAQEHILNHSVISPLLNVGLLNINEVIKDSLAFAEQHKIALNNVEGFIRQLIGWREFLRGVYHFHGRQERTRNYWGFSRAIPKSFYDATTGIEPVDITINKVLKTGYCHHIERLMVLGNFMLLCEFDPDEVYRWFMELFIDAYDWVMVPNIYGMSQFADGGLFATKPYISGSNYLKKMSNYQPGAWTEIWDSLFWRFLHTHREFFIKTPRMSMLVRTFDNMPDKKQILLIETAEKFLNGLD